MTPERELLRQIRLEITLAGEGSALTDREHVWAQRIDLLIASPESGGGEVAEEWRLLGEAALKRHFECYHRGENADTNAIHDLVSTIRLMIAAAIVREKEAIEQTARKCADMLREEAGHYGTSAVSGAYLDGEQRILAHFGLASVEKRNKT